MSSLQHWRAHVGNKNPKYPNHHDHREYARPETRRRQRLRPQQRLRQPTDPPTHLPTIMTTMLKASDKIWPVVVIVVVAVIDVIAFAAFVFGVVLVIEFLVSCPLFVVLGCLVVMGCFHRCAWCCCCVCCCVLSGVGGLMSSFRYRS